MLTAVHNKVDNHLAVDETKFVGCFLANLRVVATHPVNRYMIIGLVATHPTSDG